MELDSNNPVFFNEQINLSYFIPRAGWLEGIFDIYWIPQYNFKINVTCNKHTLEKTETFSLCEEEESINFYKTLVEKYDIKNNKTIQINFKKEKIIFPCIKEENNFTPLNRFLCASSIVQEPLEKVNQILKDAFHNSDYSNYKALKTVENRVINSENYYQKA